MAKDREIKLVIKGDSTGGRRATEETTDGLNELKESAEFTGDALEQIGDHFATFAASATTLATVSQAMRVLNEETQRQLDLRSQLSQIELTREQRTLRLAAQFGDVSQAGIDAAQRMEEQIAETTRLPLESAQELAFALDVELAQRGGVRGDLGQAAARNVGLFATSQALFDPASVIGLVQLLSTGGQLQDAATMDRGLSQMRATVAAGRGTFGQLGLLAQLQGAPMMQQGVSFSDMLGIVGRAGAVAPTFREATTMTQTLNMLAGFGTEPLREVGQPAAQAMFGRDLFDLNVQERMQLVGQLVTTLPAEQASRAFPGEQLLRMRLMFGDDGAADIVRRQQLAAAADPATAQQMRQAFAGTNIAQEMVRSARMAGEASLQAGETATIDRLRETARDRQERRIDTDRQALARRAIGILSLGAIEGEGVQLDLRFIDAATEEIDGLIAEARRTGATGLIGPLEELREDFLSERNELRVSTRRLTPATERSLGDRLAQLQAAVLGGGLAEGEQLLPRPDRGFRLGDLMFRMHQFFGLEEEPRTRQLGQGSESGGGGVGSLRTGNTININRVQVTTDKRKDFVDKMQGINP